MLLLLGCAGPGNSASKPVDTAETADPGDTATESASDTHESAPDSDTGTAGPCEGEPDPERDTSLEGLLGRLEAQGCLADADEDLLVAEIDTFFAKETVWCDAVWRVSSADGLWFEGEPERVHEHGSVPDVTVGPDGAHWLVVNDLTPGKFAEVLREDPARFWRQGYIGIGGIGLWREGESGFEEEDLDMSLPVPEIVVDPDLSWDGSRARLATFAAVWPSMDGFDPGAADLPHTFYRAEGESLTAFDPPVAVVEHGIGDGGMDPTILDVEGGEILFIGSNKLPLLGWSAPGGVYPELGTPADIEGGMLVGAPDAAVDDDGYRLYVWDPAVDQVGLLTSTDGSDWTPVGLVVDPAIGVTQNPSVVRDPDGTWWLYYAQKDAACVEAVEGGG